MAGKGRGEKGSGVEGREGNTAAILGKNKLVGYRLKDNKNES
jgi:hypothetical protein